jgi:hypothetical protein
MIVTRRTSKRVAARTVMNASCTVEFTPTHIDIHSKGLKIHYQDVVIQLAVLRTDHVTVRQIGMLFIDR